MRHATFSIFTWAIVLASPFSFGSGPARPTENLVERGIQAFKSGDFARAKQIFSLCIERDASAANFNYLAMSEWSAGNIDEAAVHFRRSIELGNDSARVHHSLGLAYLRQHQTGPGIRELQRAISIDPDFKSARYTLALAWLEAGQPGEAIPYLFQSREQSPCDREIWANLARAQFEAGDAKAALRTIHQAEEGLSANVPLFVTLAVLCSGHHQAQEARHLLETANGLAPDDLDIKLLLAKVSLQAKEPVETLAVLNGVPATHGKPGEVPFTKGVALALTGQPEAATAEFSLAIAASPGNVRYLIAQAWAYQLGGHHREALSVLKKAGQLDPRAPIVPYRTAVSYFYLREYVRAASFCEEALRLAPRYDPACLLLGVARLEQGDPQGAQTAFRLAVGIKPDLAIYHRELGVALFRAGSPGESQMELEQALALDPKATQAYFWHARVLASLGNPQQAIGDLETVVALQPNDPNAYSELAQLYSKTGQPEKAAAMLTKQKELKAVTISDERDRFLSDLTDPQL